MTITTQTLTYQANGKTYYGHFATPKDAQQPLPAVLVAPEWWGLSEHVKESAEKLAQAGYAALGLDVYGDGVLTDEASQANDMMTAALNTPDYLHACTAAALQALEQTGIVNQQAIAAIGFCFGGKVALDMARRGQNIVAAVSFHGTLTPEIPAKADTLKAKILIEHGAEDSMITADDLAVFEQEMQAVDADYHVDILPEAKHGFTNPQATENGKKNGVDIAYHEQAAKQAWENMLTFLQQHCAV